MAPQTPAQRAANEKYARRELAKKGKRVAPTYKSKLDKKPARKIPFGYIGKFKPSHRLYVRWTNQKLSSYFWFLVLCLLKLLLVEHDVAWKNYSVYGKRDQYNFHNDTHGGHYSPSWDSQLFTRGLI